ncbi:MAG TPA: holo-ACP synthase [Gemmataceae bacterium]
MEIVGTGVDIVECLRIRRMIERHGEQFLLRVYTPEEIRFCQERRNTTEEFAARWAAKEAVFKSLGTRWRKGMAWTDVEVRCQPGGEPKVSLRGTARDLADARGVGEILLSLAHCRAYATAYCLAVRGGNGREAPPAGEAS